MSEKKECIYCHRSIDAVARVCPYCNHEQDIPRSSDLRPSIPLPPIEAPPQPQPRAAARKGSTQWRTRALLIAAVFALLMASFAVGGLVYGLGKRGNLGNEEPRPVQTVQSVPRDSAEFPQLTLVPESDPTATIGRSITSAPIPDPDHKYPSEFQRSDATALPSTEYSKLLEESKRTAQPAPAGSASADPRVVAAQQPPAYAAAPAVEPERPRPEPQASRTERAPADEDRDRDSGESRRDREVRTRPIPIHQPLPRMREVEQSGTMRFRLKIGSDGRVKEVRVLETMPGMTGRMISAIQGWKFKPATENGVPVEGSFTVDVSFNAPE